MPERKVIYLSSDSTKWDVVRDVNVDGELATRHVLELRPKYLHARTLSLGAIRQNSLGKFYVLDVYRKQDSQELNESIVDVNPFVGTGHVVSRNAKKESMGVELILTNKQIEALWASIVEGGEDGMKGYALRDASFLMALDPKGERVRGVKFPKEFHGAIVHKTAGGVIDGRLYSSKASLDRAWEQTITETGRPPWRK